MKHFLQGQRKQLDLEVLFVAGTVPIPAGSDDEDLYNAMVAEGWNVTVILDSTSVTGDAAGKDVVLLSSSCASANLGTKFKSVAQGVVVCEGFVWDDMDMANTPISSAGGSDVTPESNHPMTDFLSGAQTVSVSGGITADRPNFGPGVIFLGYESLDNTDIYYFKYDKGDTGINSFVMTGRRVGLGINLGTAFGSLPATGIEYLMLACQWAASVPLVGTDGAV